MDFYMFFNKFDLDKFKYLNSILNNKEILLFFSLGWLKIILNIGLVLSIGSGE